MTSPSDLSPQLVTLSRPESTSAEAIRALRTNIMAQHFDGRRRGLAICGATKGVGGTFVAANLAVALAQAGVATLLVDGDLREPSIDTLIGAPEAPAGLAACLAAPGCRVGDYVQDEVLPNLAVFYAGAAVANSQELLAREWFEHVMNFCFREYEMTIIDTPPASTCADGRRIAMTAGYSLVVTRRNQSLVSDVRHLIDQLQGDHGQVIGTVMND